MGILITNCNLISNLGETLETAFRAAIQGEDFHFVLDKDSILGQEARVAKVNANLPEIKDENYNLRCNRLILKCLLDMGFSEYIKNFSKDRVGIIVATTNSGAMEFETSNNPIHSEIGNPAIFIKDYFGLNGFIASVSTACSSGVKAFKTAEELLNFGVCDTVTVIGVDSLARTAMYGFNSLEILSTGPSNPFGEGREGINIGEGVGAFFLEKSDSKEGVFIAGIGETTDCYHLTTQNPNGIDASNAILKALEAASMEPVDIDYINLHGTGTVANDECEANAVYRIFKNPPPASSTKPLTGHCLGASAVIEAALCYKLIETGSKKVFPHVFSGAYDEKLPKINLSGVNELKKPVETCLSLSFGFGGCNGALILSSRGQK